MACVGPCQWLCIIIIIFFSLIFAILPIFRSLIIFSQVLCEEWIVLLLKDPIFVVHMNSSTSTFLVNEKIERKSKFLCLRKIVTQMRKLRARVDPPSGSGTNSQKIYILSFFDPMPSLLAPNGNASRSFAIFRPSKSVSEEPIYSKMRLHRGIHFLIHFKDDDFSISSSHSHTNYDV